MPIFAALGAVCTLMDYSQKQIDSDLLIAEKENYNINAVKADMTKEFPFSEDEFVVAGPGCKRGESLLFESRGSLNYNDALFFLRDHQDKFFSEYNLDKEFGYLPEENRRLTVMDIENSMCELSKYCKVFYSTGRPKNKYHYTY